jgi:hypothetical protein
MTEFDDMEMELLGVGQGRPSKTERIDGRRSADATAAILALGLSILPYPQSSRQLRSTHAPVVVPGSVDQGDYSCASGSTPSASWSQ